ncbi:hypothetical protein [Sphaerisporangium album]|uniref:hypothetical protein n=1 Tax=Sphaerisporangium album TaxID=509200 RepID=UPI0015F0703F|nr:hypothetical protein [Sphaerisporangium album]
MPKPAAGLLPASPALTVVPGLRGFAYVDVAWGAIDYAPVLPNTVQNTSAL